MATGVSLRNLCAHAYDQMKIATQNIHHKQNVAIKILECMMVGQYPLIMCTMSGVPSY